MPTPTNIQSELDRHRETNSQLLKSLVAEQYNLEVTRPIFLRFSAKDREDAVGLSRLLFAKGLRLINPEPRKADHGWVVEVAVKHNVREITQENFICDLITLASGVQGRYDCWDFLSDDSAEQTQQHSNAPEAQGS